MKKITTIAAILLIFTGLSYSGEMSEQQQQNLIEKMQYLRGEIPMPLSLEEQPLHHCGTPIAFDFFKNAGNLTGKYATTAASLATRRSNICYLSIVSPDNRFRVHYTDTSFHAVYMVGVDEVGFGGVLGADGIPDYVNKIADIADSVWIFEIDTLGFMEPLKDGTNGGDSLMDIYLLDLGPSFYGVTYADTMGIPYTNQSVAAYLELDNNYDIYPYNSSSDMERRLDAARVTMAHEFFHTIHYTTDHSEYEEQGGMYVVPWWEMTATWMEEMAYDDINDYYAYLSWYYDYPWQSLRLVFGNVFHQYAACVFPLFLSEKYDYTVVRDAWQRCRDYGVGLNFMQAINDAILAYTSDTDSLLTAFNEFAIWNLFTDSRASQAPVGYRFSEAENYDNIHDTSFFVIREFCDTLIWTDPGGWPTDTLCDGTSLTLFKTNMPHSTAAHYIDMQNISFITDSIFSHYFIGHFNISWNISFIGFPVVGSSPAEIITTVSLTGGSFYKFEANPQLYSHIVAIPTPVETNMGLYSQKYGYSLLFGDSTFDKALPVEFYFGPNPVMANSPDAHVTFFAEEITTADKRVHLEVTIFNTAGEKIIELIPVYPIQDPDPEIGFDYYDHTNRVSLEWNLCNQSGTEVAPGVYLALLELKYADGSPSVTSKAKIAVIR